MDKDSYFCDICERNFTSKRIFQAHNLIHIKQNVDSHNVVLRKSRSSSKLQNHSSQSNQNNGLCVPDKKNSKLKQHIKYNRNGSQRKHSTKPTLSNKYDTDSTDIYFCELCDRSFTQKRSLKRHILFHNRKKLHACSACSKVFYSNMHLKQHFLVHTKPYSCGECDKKFSQKLHLQRHAVLHSGKKLFRCNVCSKTFYLELYLRQHMLIHAKPYSCDKCPKKFSQKRHLERHATIHTGRKTHKCSQCLKTFCLQEYLNRHLLVDHAHYQCDKCEKIFDNKYALRGHISSHCQKQPCIDKSDRPCIDKSLKEETNVKNDFIYDSETVSSDNALSPFSELEKQKFEHEESVLNMRGLISKQVLKESLANLSNFNTKQILEESVVDLYISEQVPEKSAVSLIDFSSKEELKKCETVKNSLNFVCTQEPKSSITNLKNCNSKYVSEKSVANLNNFNSKQGTKECVVKLCNYNLQQLPEEAVTDLRNFYTKQQPVSPVLNLENDSLKKPSESVMSLNHFNSEQVPEKFVVNLHSYNSEQIPEVYINDTNHYLFDERNKNTEAERNEYFENCVPEEIFSKQNKNQNELVLTRVESQGYVCFICKKSFTRNSILKRHFLIHYDCKPYVCVDCGKSFVLKDHLQNHMFIHQKYTDNLIM